MAPNFSKNAILEGDVGFFCLVCESFFRSTTECGAHVSELQHKKNFAALSYVEEFKGDCIRKINERYFCELCNKLMALDQIKIHMEDQSHIERKDVGWIKRVANVIVAFDEILINELAWNGLADNTCAICDEEYDDEKVHKNLSTHIINILQLKVEFDKNKNIYRKINDATFHCITCNMLQNLSNMTHHFKSDTHKEMYDVCRDSYTPVRKDFEVSPKVNPKEEQYAAEQLINENASTSDREQSAKSKAKEAKGTGANFKVIVEPETSKSEEEAAKPANTDGDTNNNGPAEKIRASSTLPKKDKPNNDPQYEYDDKWEERICKVLETTDYISKDDNNRPLCILCDWIIDTSKVREHIYGKHHQRLKQLHKERLDKLKHENGTEEVMKTNKLLDSLSEFQNNDVKINFEMKTAMCKKCSLYLDYDYDAIKEHISGHGKQTDKGDDNENVTIQVNYNNRSGEKKETLFSSSAPIENNNNNEEGNEAKAANAEENRATQSAAPQNTQMPDECTLERIPSKRFIRNIVSIKNVVFSDVIINKRICINHFSFLFVTYLLDRAIMRCHACNETVPFRSCEVHCSSPRHELVFSNAQVVLELESEFVREMRPGQFHCGFCNILELSWPAMEAHLAATTHIQIKSEASWRLQRYQTGIARERHERRVAERIVADMIQRNFY